MAVRVRDTSDDPGIGNVSNWQRGARQVRSFFDDFLGGNPTWNRGLRQLQQQNPGWARGAEQAGSFLTGTPERRIQRPNQRPAGGKPNFTNFDPQNLFYKQRQGLEEQGGEGMEEQEYQPLSIAEALARAMSMLPGGGSVNYDPQRNELRGRASENDARLEAMYKQLQGSYAADAPTINAAYDEATASTNETTDQGVGNINAAYDKARADQTAQLAALGIGDAAGVIAGAGQDSGAEQANAVANLEQNRGANVNQLGANKRAAGAFNTQIGQAAGLEGNLQRAANQSRLQQLLAEIDAQEQGENAQLQNSNRGAAMSLAESLVAEDWREQEYRDSRADADFQKQSMAAELAAKLQGDTAARFDPQQAISSTDAYFEANGIEPTPDEWNKVFGNMIRNYSVGY